MDLKNSFIVISLVGFLFFVGLSSCSDADDGDGASTDQVDDSDTDDTTAGDTDDSTTDDSDDSSTDDSDDSASDGDSTTDGSDDGDSTTDGGDSDDSTTDDSDDSSTGSISPFDSETFGTFLAGNDIQADNDGDGAHNWNASEYELSPESFGMDIRDYFWLEDGYLQLMCPPGDTRRRTEFREQMDRSLSGANEMEFSCRFFNVLDDKYIFAQIHNDGGVSRPYVTAFVQDGKIYIERTDSPVDSGSDRHSSSLTLISDHAYLVSIVSADGTTDVSATITDVDTEEMITETWEMPTSWEEFDGQFYFKFGAYMPNGGSDESRTQVENLEISGY